MSQTEQLRWMWGRTISAMHLWDDEGWERLSERHLQLVRETGALGDLPTALSLDPWTDRLNDLCFEF